MGVTISEHQGGPLKVRLEAARGGRLSLLTSDAQRNKVIKAALQAAGEYWLKAWLPRRFDDDYARALGYTKETSRVGRKRPAANVYGKSLTNHSPFVRSGKFARDTTKSVVQKAIATKKNQKIKIAVKGARILNFSRLHPYFMHISDAEEQNVADYVGSVIDDLMDTAKTKTKGKNKGKLALPTSLQRPKAR